jgi:hypothetical protein
MYLNLLSWLGDSDCAEFPQIDINEGRLFEWLENNRLIGRFYAKTTRTKVVPWFSKDFKEKLLEHCKRDIIRCKQQIMTLQKLNELDIINPVLFVKGVTSLVLTENRGSYRYCDDIDIFALNPEDAKLKLLSYGFKIENKTPAPHEYAIFEKDDTLIELHIGFPVIEIWDISNISSNKQRNMLPLSIKYINYNDLLSNSIVVNNNITNNKKIRVLSLEFAVLVSCLDIYKDIINTPFQRPPFKLVELFEIYDMINCLYFSIDLFERLIEQYNAQQCVKYVMVFMKYIFGVKNEVVNKLYVAGMPVFIKLFNSYFGPYKKMKEENFCKSVLFQTFDELVDSLGYIEIKPDGRIYRSQDFSQVYYSSTNEDLVDFGFSINNETTEMCINFITPGIVKKHDNVFVCYSDGGAHIWFGDRYETDKIYLAGFTQIRNKYDKSTTNINLVFNNELKKYDKFIIAFGIGNEEDEEQKVTVVPIKILYDILSHSNYSCDG